MIKLIDPLDDLPVTTENAQVPFLRPLKPTQPNDWKPKADPEGFHKPQSVQLTKMAAKAKTVDPYGRKQALMADFRNFLTVVWKFLGLPRPSAVLLSLAWWLQHGPTRKVILGFRGLSKSWVTGCYALWCLYCNPQIKVLVVSASLVRAVAQVNWALTLIREMPELQFLKPGDNQRASSQQFDVGPARPDQAPSFKAGGINGQLAGSRAHRIIGDDIEIPNNSMTPEMRHKVSEQVKEFDAIIHPLNKEDPELSGRIDFLGTPQIEDSLYPKLEPRGYAIRIWPSEYPNKAARIKYGHRLSPFIANRVLKDPTLAGHSVWPERFSDEDLAQRKLSYGRSGYALQFLIDTSLSDADKYPLKLRDLIIHGLDPIMGPDVCAWGNGPTLRANNLPGAMGFDGDFYHMPAAVSSTVSPWNSIKATIDSSGRGANETTLTIGAELNGRIGLLYQYGTRDGYSVPTLQHIAAKCVEFRVQTLIIEDNFGDGMFTALLSPYVIKAWAKFNAGKDQRFHGGTTIEAITSPRVQKEVRMLSVLEPCIQGHRLIVSPKVIEDDYKAVIAYQETVGTDNAHQYSVFHQMTHLTRERDSILQNDRIEGLAMLCAQYADVLGIDPWETAKRKEEDRLTEEWDALMAEAYEIGGNPEAAHVLREPWDRARNPVRPS